MKKSTTFVAFDVHSNSITVAVLEPLREMKGENFGVPGKNDGMKKFLPEIKKLLTEPLPECGGESNP